MSAFWLVLLFYTKKANNCCIVGRSRYTTTKPYVTKPSTWNFSVVPHDCCKWVSLQRLTPWILRSASGDVGSTTRDWNRTMTFFGRAQCSKILHPRGSKQRMSISPFKPRTVAILGTAWPAPGRESCLAHLGTAPPERGDSPPRGVAGANPPGFVKDGLRAQHHWNW